MAKSIIRSINGAVCRTMSRADRFSAACSIVILVLLPLICLSCSREKADQQGNEAPLATAPQQEPDRDDGESVKNKGVSAGNQEDVIPPGMTCNDFDLSKINFLFANRVQEARRGEGREVVDNVLHCGVAAIPVLVTKLDDNREINRQVVEFWYTSKISDVALAILLDLFTDRDGKATIPEAEWHVLVEMPRNTDMMAEAQLRRFERLRGRHAMKEKWERIWRKYRERIYWDNEEYCFRVH